MGFRLDADKMTSIYKFTNHESGQTKYLLGDGYFRKELKGLDNQRNYSFLPFNSSKYWLALSREEPKHLEKEYLSDDPELGKLKEVVILSEDDGVLRSFDALSNKVIFDRRAGVLYVRSPDTSLKAFKVDDARGVQETDVSEGTKLHFEAASELGMTFEHGLSGLSFAQIQKALSEKIEPSDKDPLHHLLFLDDIGRLEYQHGEFIYTKHGANQPQEYKPRFTTHWGDAIVANGEILYRVHLKKCLDDRGIYAIPLDEVPDSPPCTEPIDAKR